MTDYSNCPSCRILRKELDELREYNRQLADTLFGCEERFPRIPGFTSQMLDFLRCLYKRPPNEVATKEALFQTCQRYDGSFPEQKIVDVVICKMRTKMPDDSIKTLWGRGYVLTEIGRAWVAEHVRTFKENQNGSNGDSNSKERTDVKPTWHKRSGRLAPLAG